MSVGFIDFFCFTSPLDVLSGAPAPSRVPSRPGRLHCQRPPSPSAVCCDGGGRGIWGQQARRCLAQSDSFCWRLFFISFLKSMLIYNIYNDLASQRYWIGDLHEIYPYQSDDLTSFSDRVLKRCNRTTNNWETQGESPGYTVVAHRTVARWTSMNIDEEHWNHWRTSSRPRLVG